MTIITVIKIKKPLPRFAIRFIEKKPISSNSEAIGSSFTGEKSKNLRSQASAKEISKNAMLSITAMND